MRSIVLAENDVAARPHGSRRLFVAWQDPGTRAIIPVGFLSREDTPDGEAFEFRYLRRAAELERFRPFIGFPALDGVYRSADLFPFFENRLMPRTREDYPGYVSTLGLSIDADPFEILARNEGRRATDTLEVFPEPVVDEHGSVSCLFLVRGVRHIRGAHDAIDTVTVGDELHVLFDPQNEIDALAVLLRTGDYRLVGYVPAFLTSLVHRPLEVHGPHAVRITIEHIGDRNGPPHLRLLCHLTAHWSDPQPPLGGPDFEPMVTTAAEGMTSLS